MKLLFATADPAPLFPAENAVATGRHAARLPALPAELQRAGHEVSIVAPFSAALAAAASSTAGGPTAKTAPLKTKSTGVTVATSLGDNPRIAVEVLEARSPFGLQVFLFKQAEHFEKTAGGPPIADDDLAAGALFAKLVVELARRLNPAPDIVQAQDWPGALALTYLRAGRLPFAGVLAVGDPLQGQGDFGVDQFGTLNLGWEWFTPTGIEFFGRINTLKGGILAADAIVADGEGDRRALQDRAHGSRLDPIFREHASRLHGIPDGLDETAWNPATDKFIPRKFRAAALGGKKTSSNVFLASLELAKAPAGPVFVLRHPVGAPPLEYLDLLIPTLDQILSDDARLIVAGPVPDPAAPTEVALALAAKKFPAKMALVRDDPADLDERFEHSLLAAADFELVLGRGRGVAAEVVRGLRYGVVPIAPAGIGLETVVDDYRHDTMGHDHGHGIFFYEPTTDALLDAVFGRARALLAEHPARWESLRQRAMLRAAKFNWSRTAAEYTALYGKLRGK
jgi:starch synthase